MEETLKLIIQSLIEKKDELQINKKENDKEIVFEVKVSRRRDGENYRKKTVKWQELLEPSWNL